ncbi:MAG: translesion DNA synthesis-associated protein ImuA [Sulfuricella sp.]|nr:translesion DNA synthesis-associated protein ImuA [Sulfuricella sp.]
MKPALNALLQNPAIWRGGEHSRATSEAESTGFAALDGVFPGGGWPVGALTEILVEREGIGELRLVLPLLARLSREARWLAWVSPPHRPYAPALARGGVELSRLLLLDPAAAGDARWAAEQALRSGACAAVLAWLPGADERALRRLQLAAESGGACGLLFGSARDAVRSSPAALRLQLERAPRGLAVRILKRRGGPVTAPLVLDFDPGERGRENQAMKYVGRVSPDMAGRARPTYLP